MLIHAGRVLVPSRENIRPADTVSRGVGGQGLTPGPSRPQVDHLSAEKIYVCSSIMWLHYPTLPPHPPGWGNSETSSDNSIFPRFPRLLRCRNDAHLLTDDGAAPVKLVPEAVWSVSLTLA